MRAIKSPGGRFLEQAGKTLETRLCLLHLQNYGPFSLEETGVCVCVCILP